MPLKCVFFIWLGCDPGLSSVIIFFFFFFSLFDMLVGLYFYFISPLLSLISYFYQSFSLSSVWLWVFLLLFLSKYHIFLMLQFLLISPSTFQPVFIFTLPLLPCIIFSASSYLFLSSHLQLSAASPPQLCFSLSLLSLSSSLHIFLFPPWKSCNGYLLVGLNHTPGQRKRQARGGEACYSFLPSVWHVWRMEGDLEPALL